MNYEVNDIADISNWAVSIKGGFFLNVHSSDGLWFNPQPHATVSLGETLNNNSKHLC